MVRSREPWRGCSLGRALPLAVCTLLLTIAPVKGGTLTIPLRDHLNLGWTNETVSYPVNFQQGACVPASVRLSGPTGSMPVQIYDIGYWTNTTYVQTARIAFVVSTLAPLGSNSYTLTYSPDPAGTPMPDSGLSIEETSGQLLAVTRVATNWVHRPGVLLRTGEAQYDPPIPAADAPAPIIGLRTVDGTNFGGSRLYGTTASVTSFSAVVLDRGPLFARVRYRYGYSDNTSLMIDVRVDAHEGGWQTGGESFRVSFDTEVTGGSTNDGWDLMLSPNLPQTALQFLPEAAGGQSGTYTTNGYKAKALANYTTGVVTRLTPWGDWWDEFTQPLFYLSYPAGSNSAERLLMVRRTQPGDWIDPGPPAVAQPWEWFTPKQVPLLKDADGSLYLRINNAPGRRHWIIAEQTPGMRAPVLGAQNAMPGEYLPSLDEVKDMTLSWTDDANGRPRLFLNATELAQAGTEQPAALAELNNPSNLRTGLGKFAYFDTMRTPETLIYQYDAMIDNPAQITTTERAYQRARMALMTYRLASPANWSDERGYRSYNENMSIAQALNVGLAACALIDHPQSATWLTYARMRFDAWLNRLDEAGYWNESSHYARVSISKLIFFAMAMRKAGIHDYFLDPRFQRMGLLYERTLTPPDPLVDSGKRLSPPLGRGSHSSNWGFGGLFARATHETAAAFSRTSQWSYVATGYGTEMATPNPVGYPKLYPRRDLAVAQPDWSSEMIPAVGPLLRSNVGTSYENYLWLVVKNPTNPDGEWWPSETGAVVSWFARGAPLSRRFGSAPDGNDHGLLMNRVMPAANWSPGTTLPAGFESVNTNDPPVFLPHMDYINASFELQSPWTRIQTMPSSTPTFPPVPQAGALPLHWRRQLLWAHDAASPTGTQYLVFRDTVGGGQPTQWQFWTLSSRIDPPGVPDGGYGTTTRLLQGDRFTAYGQFSVDVEYFIAAPTNTPRYTLRDLTRGHGYGVNGGNYYAINQDLLHLQLPGDGAYYVALLPRARTETAPTFTAPANGRIIKIAGTFGTDYILMSSSNTSAAVDDVSLAGTAASAQIRPGATTLTLPAAGQAQWLSYGLETAGPAAMTVANSNLTLRIPSGSAAGSLYVTAPYPCSILSGAGVVLTPAGSNRVRVSYSAGTTMIVLERNPITGTLLLISSNPQHTPETL